MLSHLSHGVCLGGWLVHLGVLFVWGLFVCLFVCLFVFNRGLISWFRKRIHSLSNLLFFSVQTLFAFFRSIFKSFCVRSTPLIHKSFHWEKQWEKTKSTTEENPTGVTVIVIHAYFFFAVKINGIDSKCNGCFTLPSISQMCTEGNPTLPSKIHKFKFRTGKEHNNQWKLRCKRQSFVISL